MDSEKIKKLKRMFYIDADGVLYRDALEIDFFKRRTEWKIWNRYTAGTVQKKNTFGRVNIREFNIAFDQLYFLIKYGFWLKGLDKESEHITKIDDKYLDDCFEYDRKEKTLTWKVRPRQHFKSLNACVCFNTKKVGMKVNQLCTLNKIQYTKENIIAFFEYGVWVKKTTVDSGYLKEAIDYNPKTGICTWKNRPYYHFDNMEKCRKWNDRWVGRTIGNKYKYHGGNATSYYTFSINSESYRLHRVIWCLFHGEWPKEEIDHIDHNGLNNKIDNLRDATREEQSKNRPISINNSSGCAGVYWHKGKKAWRARITVQRKRRYLGDFKDKEKAIKAVHMARLAFGFHENHGT